MEQLFVAAAGGCRGDAFERQLYLIRKQASHQLRGESAAEPGRLFYICSLSTQGDHLQRDAHAGPAVPCSIRTCSDPAYMTHLAMVHSRFSTNTFPSWDRAQPLRFMSHNGEINTLRGNINWMRAREGMMRSELSATS